MKKTKIIFWIVTGLFTVFMLMSAVQEILNTPHNVTFMNHLGYPNYISPMLGIAKVLGLIAILIPGMPKIKEWAYAGLFFDLIGATYSMIANDGLKPQMAIMLLPFIFLAISYRLYHKRMQATA